MKTLSPLLLILLHAGVVAPLWSQSTGGGDRPSPGVLQDEHPRVLFFRVSEGQAARGIPYEVWEPRFSRLMGIIGKVLEEEVPGRSKYNIEYFTRFKKAHPDQLVLLHYNGNGRDPRYQTGEYFAGHWVYHGGSRILSQVPAEPGETEIRVASPELYATDTGRYRRHHEDIGLCELDHQGRPDWRKCEQVQLLSVDLDRGVIRVKRGSFGTEPRAFVPGKAYAAAHACEGPWGQQSNLLWYYNYSTRCPRDAGGRRAGEVHADELARRFARGGDLELFDGIEFDVLMHRRGGRGASPARGLDMDADGLPDNGVFDDVNSYGIGVIDFLQGLRERLGPDRLLLADGHGASHQRAVTALNGIESEGWPSLSDWEIRDWSGGLNRHAFWMAMGRRPAFSYVNHKYVTHGEIPGVTKRPSVPMSTHRLVFAAAVFSGSAICAIYPPPGDEGPHGVWDEFWMGTEKRLGWLGKPLGPAVHLAETSPALQWGRLGENAESSLLKGEGFVLQTVDTGVELSGKGETRDLRFTLGPVTLGGPDLFVTVNARSAPMKGYPPSMPRLMEVSLVDHNLLSRPDVVTGMQLRGGGECPIDAASGARVRYAPAIRLDGKALAGFQVHPPYRGGVGMSYWEQELTLPRERTLRFSTGMGDLSPGRSDGVLFRVELTVSGGHQPPAVLLEHQQVDSTWIPHRIDLTRFGGKRVKLRFIADAGPGNDATTDHASWGDVRIALPGEDPSRRPLASSRSMTWVEEREFRSRFYFDGVAGRTVDLEFHVEGSEPIRFTDLSIHGARDLVYREFEHGLVVANPSRRASRIDLARLLPGKRFKRFQGTPRQDPVTNDGTPVTAPLRLGPKDAIFLVRQGSDRD